MQRPIYSHQMKSKKAGVCIDCKGAIVIGEDIVYTRKKGAEHQKCFDEVMAKVNADTTKYRGECEECFSFGELANGKLCIRCYSDKVTASGNWSVPVGQEVVVKKEERKDLGTNFLPDNAQWTNRFKIAGSTGREYTIAQRKSNGEWKCSCPGNIFHGNCKHIGAIRPMLNEIEKRKQIES